MASIDGLDIIPGLEEAFFKVVRFFTNGGTTVLGGRRTAVARGERSKFADISLFVLWGPLYDSLSSIIRGHWTTYWGTLPFGPHSGLGEWPGSGFSAFVYLNAPRYKAGLPLILDPYPPSLSWTRTLTTPLGSLWCVAYSAVISALVAPYRDATARTFFSSDGAASWLSLPANSGTFPFDVIWISELSLFVKVGAGSANQNVQTSVDGETWISRTAVLSGAFNRIAWSPARGRMVAVGASGTTSKIGYSSDGISWTVITPPDCGELRGVIWNDTTKRFVVVGEGASGYGVLVSADGISWTRYAAPFSSALADFAYSPVFQRYLVMEDTTLATTAYVSDDLINWTTVSTGLPPKVAKVAWGDIPGCFVSVALGTLNAVVWASIDGALWYDVSPSFNISPNRIIYVPELSRFVCVGLSATMYST